MGNLAIIPARGGSKRIPGKNIKLFLGKPIIQYPIEKAIKSRLFDEIMVSSDDEAIISTAIKLGAKAPFVRSQKVSDDHSTLSDVLSEVLEEYRSRGKIFDNVCLLLPTAPFITVENLLDAYEKLISSDLSGIIPVVRFSYPIQRALFINEKKELHMIWPENKSVRSQDLPASYHDSGLFYWLRTGDFLREKQIFMQRVGAVELKEMQVQDIDTEDDWKMAELKYKILEQQ